MCANKRRLDRETIAERGRLLYDEQIAPRLPSNAGGRFVAIDVESGDYEVDGDDFAVTQRLLERRPGAQIWLVRVGRTTAYRVGASDRFTAS